MIKKNTGKWYLMLQKQFEFFGFDRIVYGNFKKKIRKWYEEFREKEQNTIHIGLDD